MLSECDVNLLILVITISLECCEQRKNTHTAHNYDSPCYAFNLLRKAEQKHDIPP